VDADTFRVTVLDGQQPVLEHPMYRSLRSLDDLRVFMAHHVFAVWDFMSLLKALQRALTCVTVPWLPPVAPTAVTRWVNEVVLGEESDEIDGEALSHVELYLRAMREVGAPRGAFVRFLGLLGAGRSVSDALDQADAPLGAAMFVRATFATITTGSVPRIAGAFCGGREELIPEMFTRTLDELGPTAPSFERYLERHVEIDGDLHGPLAAQLLAAVCVDPQSWDEAIVGAQVALDARSRLWSAVHASQPVLTHA